MTVVNNGDDDVELGVQFGEGGGDVRPSRSRRATPSASAPPTSKASTARALLLEGIDAQPGGLARHVLPVRRRRGHRDRVPVLDSRLPEYADLARRSAARAGGATRLTTERMPRGIRLGPLPARYASKR